MKITQATFSPNCPVAFVLLSAPQSLLEDCWAEAGERVIIIGMRKLLPEVRNGIEGIADGSEVWESKCLGTSVTTKFKAVIADDVEKIRGFLGGMAVDGIISKAERDKALSDLGVRSAPIHPLLSSMDFHVGAGI